MQASGIGPQLVRVLARTSPALLADLFPPGRLVDAEVISVYQGRAVLAFARGLRLEVALETALQEGQRVRLQVQPRGAGEAIVLRLLQPQPSDAQPRADQVAVVWLPIPLPDGQQGWAQLQVPEQREDGAEGGAQVRLLWETPALGQVQVTLQAAAGLLTTLFTVQQAAVKPALEAGMGDLIGRLSAAGFDRVQAGCRQALPGEAGSPAVRPGGPLLDRRL